MSRACQPVINQSITLSILSINLSIPLSILPINQSHCKYYQSINRIVNVTNQSIALSILPINQSHCQYYKSINQSISSCFTSCHWSMLVSLPIIHISINPILNIGQSIKSAAAPGNALAPATGLCWSACPKYTGGINQLPV
jgi:hypothetical protein